MSKTARDYRIDAMNMVWPDEMGSGPNTDGWERDDFENLESAIEYCISQAIREAEERGRAEAEAAIVEARATGRLEGYEIGAKDMQQGLAEYYDVLAADTKDTSLTAREAGKSALAGETAALAVAYRNVATHIREFALPIKQEPDDAGS